MPIKEVSAIQNKRSEDKGTKYFFNIIRAKHKRELIDNIQISGDVTNDPNCINDAFFRFSKDPLPQNSMR